MNSCFWAKFVSYLALAKVTEASSFIKDLSYIAHFMGTLWVFTAFDSYTISDAKVIKSFDIKS